MKVLKKIADAGAQAPDPQTGNTAPNATVVINKATVTES
jgi:peptidyl-prolyl cis-trans isomerase B (cyclophilin B)